MEKALTGKRIAIAGSRKTEEMSVLIEKQGGTALVRPLQGTVFLAEEQVKPELQKYMNEGADWSIFTTGIGIESLIKLSEDMSARDSFLQRIQNSQVGSRGYKTFAALKKMGIAPVAVDEDGTTNSLIKALSNFDLSNKRVMVQLHGEKAPSLMAFLQEQGASVQTILPYQHIPPEEAVVEQLCTELINGEVNAVCFTTAIQVRSLFNFAKERHLDQELRQVFNQTALAGAVGKVTAEALVEEDVERMFVPELERMGALIIELSRYFKNI